MRLVMRKPPSKIFTAKNTKALAWCETHTPSVYMFEDRLNDLGLRSYVSTLRCTSTSYRTLKRNAFAYEVKGFVFFQSWLTIVGVLVLNPFVFGGTRPFFRLWGGDSRSTHNHILSMECDIERSARFVVVPAYEDCDLQYWNHAPVANFDAVMQAVADAPEPAWKLIDWRLR